MSVFLSIIVPVYNAEQYIEACINSVIAQNSKELELLLIDDGSKDNSAEICLKYAREYSYIKYFKQKNSGPSIARNLGIMKATGKYVSFLDADDLLSGDYFEIVKQRAPETELLFFCHAELFSDSVSKYYKLAEKKCMNQAELNTFLLELKTNPLKIEFCNFTWNKCFSLDVIRKNNIFFPNSLRTREDEIFTNLYCSCINTCLLIPACLYYYRITDTGLTSRKKNSDQLISLSLEMLKSITWQQNDLYNFSVARAFNFFMEGASLSFMPRLLDFKAFYYQYRKNRIIKNRLLFNLSLNHNFIVSSFFFILISCLKFSKRLIKGVI